MKPTEISDIEEQETTQQTNKNVVTGKGFLLNKNQKGYETWGFCSRLFKAKKQ